jgi:mRNA-degrading endonuclease RelE of RelBE toxin-antitoxin system
MNKPYRLMNAAEIIEQIKQLPPEERNKVVDFTRQLPNEETFKAMAEPMENLERFESVEDLFAELEK